MTTKTDITLPEPAFKLRWHDDTARYTVSVPNIGDTDCYTADQVRAAVEADRQEHLRDAAKMMPSDESLEKAWDSFEAEMARHPTDGELEEFMAQFADEQGNIADDRHAEAARAVLSRYGDSQPAASAEPDDMPPLDDRAAYPASQVRCLIREDRARRAAPVAAQAQPQQSENQEALADTQRAIIEAAERRGYERAIAECAQVARAAKEQS